jgi:hypothetical protein
MKTQQELQEYIRQHPDHVDHAISRNLRRQGVTTQDVKQARAAMNGKEVEDAPPAAAKKVIGSSVRDLLHQFDELAKVKATMRMLSRSSYLEDDEMRVKSGVSLRAWSTVRTHKDVMLYRYKLPNQHYVWMHPEAQKELTDAINISQT